jgi:hypothetical protein
MMIKLVATFIALLAVLGMILNHKSANAAMIA